MKKKKTDVDSFMKLAHEMEKSIKARLHQCDCLIALLLDIGPLHDDGDCRFCDGGLRNGEEWHDHKCRYAHALKDNLPAGQGPSWMGPWAKLWRELTERNRPRV